MLREQCQQDSAKVSEALAAGGLAAAEAERRGALQPGTVIRAAWTQQVDSVPLAIRTPQEPFLVPKEDLIL